MTTELFREMCFNPFQELLQSLHIFTNRRQQHTGASPTNT